MNKKKFIDEWVKPILIALIIFIGISTFFRIGEVDGNSMMPTYEDGDRVLIFKHPLEIEKGDIVIFNYTDSNEKFYQEYLQSNNMIYAHSPSEPGEKHIKRVVGVPGDEVVIKDNVVYINGEEQFISNEMEVYDQSYTLAEDEYFLVGDNLNNSYDSRMHGPVNKKDIYGKLITKN